MISVCNNPEKIKKILKSDCLWSLVAEEGINKEEYEPDFLRYVYLSIDYDGDCVGMYTVERFNGYTIILHPAILKKCRAKYADNSMKDFFSFIKERLDEKIKCVLCFFPEYRKDLVRFAEKHSFERVGKTAKSAKKDGDYIGQFIYSKVLA